jgi:hypothetical protein
VLREHRQRRRHRATNLLLNDLRLPVIKVLWPQVADQSDKER